jgi:hypothetical protein
LTGGFEFTNEFLGLLELTGRTTWDILDDTVETSDEWVEAGCQLKPDERYLEYSLCLITDGQTGSLITRETSIVDRKRGRTGILASSGDDVVSQGLSPDELLDWVESD